LTSPLDQVKLKPLGGRQREFPPLSRHDLPVAASAQANWSVIDDEVYGRVLTVGVFGTISANDSDVLSKAVSEVPDADVRIAILASDGGDLRAAMQMGRILRSHGFNAVISDGQSCLSACVFLLAASIGKTVNGNVGIHRPYFVGGSSGSVAEEIQQMKDLSAAYFREMNIPDRLAEDMFSVDPAKIRILSPRELEDYRLNAKDFVAQETDIVRMMHDFGLSRAEYEAFRADHDYYCRVFKGQHKRMQECVTGVAERHGVKMGDIKFE
jgi:hypothetical protein